MANEEVNQLPAIGALALEDVVHVNDVSISNTSNKATIQDIVNLVPAAAGGLLAANNLSDVNSAPTSRSNLGLGSASLEPYESGSWTPVLEDLSANQANMESSTIGRYTRIGDNVTIYCFVKTTSLGSVSGNLRVSGLPFTALKINCALATDNGTTLFLPASTNISARTDINESRLSLFLWADSFGTTPLTSTDWTSIGGCAFAGSYFIG